MKKETTKLMRICFLFSMLFIVNISFGQKVNRTSGQEVSENNVSIFIGDVKEIGFNVPEEYEFSHFTVEGEGVSDVKVIDSNQSQDTGLRKFWKKVLSFLGFRKGNARVIIYLKPKIENEENNGYITINININIVEKEDDN